MEIVLPILAFALGAACYHLLYRLVREKKILGHEKSITIAAERHAYQAEVLREIGERIGYSLDVAKIIEIITGSLGKLLEYHTVSYMTKNGDRIIFKCILQESVNRAFVDDVKKKMLAAFSAMVNQQLNENDVDESITGTIFDENTHDPVRSFFNLPLIINNEVMGLITVASLRVGLYTEEETAVLYTITTLASNAVTKLAQVLTSEKSKLNALVASLSDGIVMVDAAWNLQVVNPQAKTMLGLPDGAVTMLDVLDKLGGKIDLRTKIEETVKKMVSDTIPEVTVNNKTLQIFTTAVKDSGDQPLGAVVVFHDVTHAKDIERLREEFTAMMIHELRSPLTNVRTTTDSLLRTMSQTDNEVSQSLGTIRNEVTDMLELVNDLLDVAKVEAGKFTVTKTPTDLGKLIEEVVERHKTRTTQKNIEMISQISGDNTAVSLDAFRIRQVLTNLATNAIKFTESGSITIRAIRGDNVVTVSVEDTGVGIPKEAIGDLFTKFHQLNQPQEHREGTGLGLVIARGIIEAHGGKMWVESEAGVGSKFFFTLPL